MKVLVTGGAGFIGSHVVDKLVRKNFDVVIVDDFSTGKRKNINERAQLYQCDIMNEKALDDVINAENPEIVIHHAAQISVQNSISAPEFDANVNIIGTINLLHSCIRHHVKKIIYASSAAVYGEPQYLPVDEEHILNPLSPYGISKHTPEHYIKAVKELFGLEYTILRYANVYGPRQDAQGEGGVVSIFIDRLLQGEPIIIYGDGHQTRDFVYVKDIATANLSAISNGMNQVINISTNSNTSVKDLFYLLCEINNSYIAPEYHLARQGDIVHSYLDNQKAFKNLNWKPEFSLFEGLRQTLEYYEKDQQT